MSSSNNDSNIDFKVNIFPIFWLDDIVSLFYWNYNDRPYRSVKNQKEGDSGMSFLESVFSFLFGDGNPNKNLEEYRWSLIGTVIKNNKGAVIAEQIAPYLDNLGRGDALEYEEYMLPILARFDGRPEVSPEGQIIYHFPTLQVTAIEEEHQSILPYLQEFLWQFSQATSGQIMLAIGLGGVNLIGALMLGNLLGKLALSKISLPFLGWVAGIYPVLLFYGVGFLTLPLIRYFWIQWKNQKIELRNGERKARTNLFDSPDKKLKKKLKYARKFAKQSLIDPGDLAYTTEQDLLQQEVEQSAKLDAQWEKRLNQSTEHS